MKVNVSQNLPRSAPDAELCNFTTVRSDRVHFAVEQGWCQFKISRKLSSLTCGMIHGCKTDNAIITITHVF